VAKVDNPGSRVEGQGQLLANHFGEEPVRLGPDPSWGPTRAGHPVLSPLLIVTLNMG
jgi:hypothetical protein